MSESATQSVEPAGRLPAALELGAVELDVAAIDRARAFYEQVIGLSGRELDDGRVELAAGLDGAPLVTLHPTPGASQRDPRRTGLFHLAILVPTRRDLAQSLMRLAARGWPLDGASDHLVSEALYLSDPEGNGIEIYRDRPRGEWPHDGAGNLEMATLPLDLESIAGELRADPSGPAAHVAAGTHIGHVHLQVHDLAAIERFYDAVLGFDVMVRGYPGALFVSAGGYHHHLGLNTWNSRGAAPPEPGSAGLRNYNVVLPDAADLGAALERLEAGGVPVAEHPDGALVRDPAGNALVLRAAS